VFLNDHIAEVHADAKSDAPLLSHLRLALGHRALDLNRAANRIHDTRELGQEAVAGVLYDPAPMLPDLWTDQLPKMGLVGDAFAGDAPAKPSCRNV
jgi:hypothetical protein